MCLRVGTNQSVPKQRQFIKNKTRRTYAYDPIKDISVSEKKLTSCITGEQMCVAYPHRIVAVQVYFQAEACITELQDRHFSLD
jgi:hypothetical protein